MAIQDYYRGNTTWIDPVTTIMEEYTQNLGLYGGENALTGYTGDANYWALAFYYAYRTYKQSTLLDRAFQIHNITNTTCFITPIAAASGSGIGRNESFLPPSNCTGGMHSCMAVYTATDFG